MPDQRLDLILHQLDDLPTLPAIAVRVLDATGRDDTAAGARQPQQRASADGGGLEDVELTGKRSQSPRARRCALSRLSGAHGCVLHGLAVRKGGIGNSRHSSSRSSPPKLFTLNRNGGAEACPGGPIGPCRAD